MRKLLPWTLGVMMGVLTLAGALSLPVPASAQAVAAVFPPWWGVEESWVAAGDAGQILGAGLWRNVVVLRGGDGDLASRLQAAGALIVVDANVIGCTTPRASL